MVRGIYTPRGQRPRRIFLFPYAHVGVSHAQKSAEALCLQACRGFEPAPNPPNLQNLKQAHKGEGLPSPYPLPDGPARSVATFFNGGAAPLESKIRGKNVYLLLMGPTRPVHMHIIRPK